MKTFLKHYHALMAKGFATDEEKAKLKELAEDVEGVEDKVEEAEALPTEETPDEADVEKSLKNLLTKATDEVREESKELIEKQVEEKVKAALADHTDLKEKRAGLYSKEVQASKAETNKRVRKFFRALVKNDFTTLEKMQSENPLYKKELTTDDTASPYGGYVVDSELSAEIRHLVTEYGVARREMTTHELTKGSYKVNELVTDLTVNWADTETASLLSTQFVLGQGTLELKRLYAIVTLTNTLLEDSEIDLTSFISERVAEGMAMQEDEAFFNGDGTATYGSFTGLLATAGLNSVTMTGSTFASMDADDLIAMQDATPQGALRNGKYYMHRSIMSIVRKLKDSDGAYIYQRPAEGGPATIWGKPVVEVEVMPTSSDTAANTPFVLFGDMKKAAIFGYKGTIRAEMFNAGVVRNVADDGDINLITSDRRAVRFIERVGYVTVLENAMTKLVTAAASA